jgi:hypothetical protein
MIGLPVWAVAAGPGDLRDRIIVTLVRLPVLELRLEAVR